jgi:mannose-6-phosphate isomerase
MWYVMDHEQDAEIILGLKDKNQEKEIPHDITLNNIDDVFEQETVQKGDVYFIPAGKVHAIGAGVMVAEIQQTSDITYRIYDWDREDTCGNKRELHTDLARQATKHLMDIPKKEYSSVVNEAKNVVHNQYFTTNVLDVCNHFKQDLEGVDSFVIYMCVEGRVSITVDNHTEILETGETILLPASSSDAIFYTSKAKLLEVFLDPMASESQAKAA